MSLCFILLRYSYAQIILNSFRLEELFNQFGQVEKVNRIKDYAFIFFESRDGAISAQTATNGMELMGSHISVSLAKPAAKNKDSGPKLGYRSGLLTSCNCIATC